jgi:hypothetical protein
MVVTSYLPAVQPRLPAELLSSERIIYCTLNPRTWRWQADVQGDRFRLDFALAISKSIAGAPAQEVIPFSAVDAYECHDDMAFHRSS